MKDKTFVEYMVYVAMALISLLILLIGCGTGWLIYHIVTSPVVQTWLGY